MHIKRTLTGYQIGSINGHLGKGLSPRETQAVACYAADMTQPQIALLMHCSISNISHLIRNAHFKLGTYRPAGLISAAYHKGVITRLLALFLLTGGLLDDGNAYRPARGGQSRTGSRTINRTTRMEQTT